MIGAVAAAVLALAPTAPPPSVRGIEDFGQLKAELQRSYANLAWLGSREGGVDLPALEERTREAIAAAKTDEDVVRALRAFGAGMHDGHLSELPFLAPSAQAAPDPPPPALNPADATGGCAALGFAPAASVAFSAPFESLPDVELLSDGLSEPFRLAVANLPNGRKIGVIRIPAFRSRSSPGACVAAWRGLVASGASLTPDRIREAARDRWFAALADDLRRLQDEGAQAVLVDIGNNSGGDDSGDWAVRVFTTASVQSSRLLVSSAPAGRAYFDEEIADLDAVPAGAANPVLSQTQASYWTARATLENDHCDLSWVWRERRSWPTVGCLRLTPAGYASGPLRTLPPSQSPETAAALYWPSKVTRYAAAWVGPVTVLIDGKSYSSAEMFAAEMQDNHVARLVGVRTGGDGCGFMTESQAFVLTNTRLRFRIPNCVRLRADGTDEVKGVSPDEPLPPTEGVSDRARAARILELAATPN